MPANAQVIFGVLFQIASFDMIPTDDIYADMLAALETDDQPDVFMQKMDSFGFESIWLLPNLGSIIYFIGLFPILILIYVILYCCARCKKQCIKRRNRLRGFIFWNWPIQFLRDNFIVFIIASLYNIKHKSWRIEQASLNTNTAYSIFGLLLLFQFVSQLFLYKRRLMLDKKAFRNKYEAAYKGLAVTHNKFLFYPLLNYSRYILVPMSVILFPRYLYA